MARSDRDPGPLQGDLQIELMSVLWRRGSATVEQARSALPSRYRGAYTTVQTVLNRLADRGLLERERAGTAFVYRPRVTESQYVARSIERTLSSASRDARQTALAELIGRLDGDELSEVQRRAEEIKRRRGRGPA